MPYSLDKITYSHSHSSCHRIKSLENNAVRKVQKVTTLKQDKMEPVQNKQWMSNHPRAKSTLARLSIDIDEHL